MKDKSMFIGRDTLIEDLSQNVNNNQVKSIILYGQKRAGKSSIFFHLKEKLLENENYIPIYFSMGKSGSGGIEDFFKSVIIGLEEYYEDLFEEDLFCDIGVGLKEVDSIILFVRFVKKAVKQINRLLETDKKELVLLIDEFTYVYGAIKAGLYSSLFMQNWKAMLEENIFKALLIGQDSMPEFLKEFPNEFGVIEQIRVTYLDIKSAKKLINEPILMQDGSSRYMENSINSIIAYSACSPYFIQKICKEIVNVLNQKQSNKITNLIVDKAIDEIINGYNGVKLEFFDNLYSLGAGEDATTMQKRLDLLILIANNDCVHYNDDTKVLIKELLSNEVIEKLQTQYKIKVKLFEKFLKTHYGKKDE
ncbi:MAG: ATP-binding protein [Sulfurimonas sp.]|nr:ATP-binding protein [Sulfurimonas sp.]